MNSTFSHLTNGYRPNSDVKLKLAILGSPGSGKSTLSAGLLYFSKLFLFKVDSVPEVAKWDFYKGVDFTADDYEYKKFKAQQELEDIYPQDIDITICEAPLIISAIYAEFYRGNDDKIARDMFALAKEHKERYSHFLVSRKLVAFEEFGRNENEKQANLLHQKTLEILERLQINYTVINRYDDHIPLQILDMLGAIHQRPEAVVEPIPCPTPEYPKYLS
ncbi:MAG: AAA family ATPase [Halobacteriovoraceae bacterium]|jgi:nicotinamide riboside kinase|nr:AAA family ATPase [Halobacteriovoraceae bacterium]MBT5093064.1 AAA family ATPase [Halobacteriovoraceae bacterium]